MELATYRQNEKAQKKLMETVKKLNAEMIPNLTKGEVWGKNMNREIDAISEPLKENN